MEARRVKGLCYWCPEKYVAGHRCSSKHFFVIETEEDGDNGEPEELEGGAEGEIKVETTPDLSIHTITGTLG